MEKRHYLLIGIVVAVVIVIAIMYGAGLFGQGGTMLVRNPSGLSSKETASIGSRTEQGNYVDTKTIPSGGRSSLEVVPDQVALGSDASVAFSWIADVAVFDSVIFVLNEKFQGIDTERTFDNVSSLQAYLSELSLPLQNLTRCGVGVDLPCRKDIGRLSAGLVERLVDFKPMSAGEKSFIVLSREANNMSRFKLWSGEIVVEDDIVLGDVNVNFKVENLPNPVSAFGFDFSWDGLNMDAISFSPGEGVQNWAMASCNLEYASNSGRCGGFAGSAPAIPSGTSSTLFTVTLDKTSGGSSWPIDLYNVVDGLAGSNYNTSYSCSGNTCDVVFGR